MNNYLYITIIICAIASGCGSSKPSASANAVVGKKKLSTVFFDANKARLQKENAKAKELYLLAIQQEPNNAAAYYYYAKINMATGDAKKTVEFSKIATELAPDNKYYLEQYADALANNGDYKKAIAVYKNLAKTDGKLAERYLMTATYYESKLGLSEDAIGTMNELEKYYGISADMSFRKISLLKKLNKTDDVIAEFDKLIKEEPNEVKYYLLKLDELENTKQTEKAIIFSKLIDIKFANSAQLLPSNTIKALEKKDTAKYFELLQQCMDSKGIEPEEKIALLIPVMQMNTKDEALQAKLIGYGKNMVDAAPEDGKALAYYATMLLNSKQYNLALIQFNKLIQKNPNQFDNWQQVFYIYSQQDQYDSLITFSKKAMNYFPNQAIVYYMNGIANQQRNNIPTAIKSLNKALDYAGSKQDINVRIYTALGDAYNTQKDYANSDSSFEKCLSIDADNETVLNNYAYFLSIRKINLEKAATMSKKSLVIRPGEKTFLDTYAWILYMQKKYEEAAKIMKQAIDTNGENDATMLDHYGDILSMLNDKQNAKKYWMAAKEKGSKNMQLDKKIANGEVYE